jgi:ADP-dependent phosphofructokinase/glucokinase
MKDNLEIRLKLTGYQREDAYNCVLKELDSSELWWKCRIQTHVSVGRIIETKIYNSIINEISQTLKTWSY